MRHSVVLKLGSSVALAVLTGVIVVLQYRVSTHFCNPCPCGQVYRIGHIRQLPLFTYPSVLAVPAFAWPGASLLRIEGAVILAMGEGSAASWAGGILPLRDAAMGACFSFAASIFVPRSRARSFYLA